MLTLDGEIVARHAVDVPADRSDVFAAIVRLARDVIADAHAPVLGLGVGTPGVVDDRGVVLAAPGFGWTDVDLAGQLEAEPLRRGDEVQPLEVALVEVPVPVRAPVRCENAEALVVTQRARRHPGALGDLARQAQWGLGGRALEHDLGAVAARGQELRHRHAQRHEDRRRDAELLRGEGHALRVVARRRGDDSARALLGRETRESVGRAADLEGAGALEVLELEVHRHAEEVGEVLRHVERGARDDTGEEGGGILELREGRRSGREAGVGRAHGRTLLGRGTVLQMKSPVGGAPVSHARSPR